ncbi:FtsQ-type POTRA domain-containing protein [Candidatus Peregrinibacteria bacterium]|nr:MAG: FtsQ-type POTRA domain-containing protein [Candidatus Peregrinibacteria bacterium]
MAIWRKNKPKRLYYPVESNWIRRRRSSPPRRQVHRPIGRTIGLFFKKWAYLVMGLAFLTLVITVMSLSSALSIQNIQVERDSFFTNTTAVESITQPWKGRSMVLMNKSALQEAISKEFPEFERIKIQKKWPDTLRITLISHPIIANLKVRYTLPTEERWLEEESDALTQAINELDLAPNETGAETPIKLPFKPSDLSNAFDLGEEKEEPELEVFEQKGLLNSVGQALFDQEENLEMITLTLSHLTQPVSDREEIIPTAHMQFWRTAQTYFENTLDQVITGIEYLPTARELHFTLPNGTVIWLSAERDPKEQIDKLITIYQTDAFEEGDLSYIDLRVKEKVIYCLKTAPCAQ